jgi:transcription initiation factor TFIIIB Brf1 subunit/transcription initiation factor TFIIB
MAACRDIRYVMTYEDLVGGVQDLGRITNINHMIARSGSRYGKSIAGVLGWRTPKWFTVEDFVTYYSGKLGVVLNGETIRQARDVISKNHRSYRDPRANPSAPHVHAAAALFIALRKAHVDISQHDYCQKVNLSEISLRGHVKSLGGYGTTKIPAKKINPEDPGLDDC